MMRARFGKTKGGFGTARSQGILVFFFSSISHAAVKCDTQDVRVPYQ